MPTCYVCARAQNVTEQMDALINETYRRSEEFYEEKEALLADELRRADAAADGASAALRRLLHTRTLAHLFCTHLPLISGVLALWFVAPLLSTLGLCDMWHVLCVRAGQARLTRDVCVRGCCLIEFILLRQVERTRAMLQQIMDRVMRATQRIETAHDDASAGGGDSGGGDVGGHGGGHGGGGSGGGGGGGAGIAGGVQ
jgi:uncharacterized membrane protein YgcG